MGALALAHKKSLKTLAASPDLSFLFRKSIADHLQASPENIFLYWKGRVALYALLKSMNVGEGDEVIIPAFTCVVVPNAILYLGAKPVYVDIDRKTYNINVDLIEEKINPRTKVILAQNTFGLPPDIEGIQKIAQKNNLRVLEDCTHGFGGQTMGKPNGTIAEASFFSSQWNKPFSTGIGGFAYARDPMIISRLRDLEKQFIQPSYKDQVQLRSMIAVRNSLNNSSVYWMAVKTYRWLSKMGLVIGSSTDNELNDILMPADYLKAMSTVQIKHGIGQVAHIKEYIDKRNTIAQRYSAFLSGEKIPVPFFAENMQHTFLKYPLLVNDRALFFERAQKAKIEIGDWFISPIHPVTKNFERWNFEATSCPVADYSARHIINLPTNPAMSDREVEKVISFLKANRDLIIR